MPLSRVKSLYRDLKMLTRALFDLAAVRFRIQVKPAARFPERTFLARLVGWSVEHVSGPQSVEATAGDVLLLSVIKDGREFLREFIEHHQRLGVKHIVLLDNGSTDDSIDIAAEYKNVTVLQTLLPFGTYARIFRLYLKMRFGHDCWCLSIDMDELFDFPYSERISLDTFVRYLNEQSFNAVLVNMLEPVADAPLNSSSGAGGTLIRERYRYYDQSCIVKHDVCSALNREPLHEFRSGGIRASYFGWTDGHLAKYPLVKFGPDFGCRESLNHRVSDRARLADLSCVLFHYQFTETLHQRARDAANNRNYGNASRKYRHFLQILDRKPEVNLLRESLNPKELTGVNSLIENGYIVAGRSYRTYVNEQAAT
jgi:glycosyltransferase involved in cell wall biosynthesis